MTFTIGELKQELIRINNEVNQELFGFGLKRQKVLIEEDKIFIVAINSRVTPLQALHGKDDFTSRIADLALLQEFKARLFSKLIGLFGSGVLTVMKDYDPKTELAGTIIVLRGDALQLWKEHCEGITTG